MLAFLFVLLFAVLIIAISALIFARRQSTQQIRHIPAFERLQNAIALAVEDGSRLHVTLGARGISGPEVAAAFVGLSVLQRVARVAADSDLPPIASTGDGVLALLAQDSLRATYARMGRASAFDPALGRITGLTPFSYAAGALPIIADEDVSTNVLAGSFGNEVALLAAAGQRSSALNLAGSDNLPAQAILYASVQEPLIGEELYASGAYLDAGPAHTASLHAQDVMRVVLALVIIGGALVGIFQ